MTLKILDSDNNPEEETDNHSQIVEISKQVCLDQLLEHDLDRLFRLLMKWLQESFKNINRNVSRIRLL